MHILFICNDYCLHNHLVEKLIQERPNDTFTIIKVALVLKGKNRVDSANKILPKLSKRFIFQKIIEFILLFIITHLPKLYFKGAIFRKLSGIANKHQCAYYETDNILSKVTLDFIKNSNPDLIFTLFHQIIKQELIDILPHGIINIHPGILPDTKGIQPYFWNLINNSNTDSGATFHYITDETVDTGALLAKASFKPWKGISVQLNYYLTIKCASAIINNLIEQIKNNSIAAKPQAKERGSYYSWPSTKDMDTLYQKGFKLISFTDLFKILFGTYDDFRPEFQELYTTSTQ